LPEVTYGMTYEIDKFHSKIVYVGLAQACPNYFVFRIAISKTGLVAGCPHELGGHRGSNEDESIDSPLV